MLISQIFLKGMPKENIIENNIKFKDKTKQGIDNNFPYCKKRCKLH